MVLQANTATSKCCPYYATHTSGECGGVKMGGASVNIVPFGRDLGNELESISLATCLFAFHRLGCLCPGLFPL